MANKYMSLVNKLPGIVKNEGTGWEIFDQGVRHPSPSFNFILGNTHVIPFGASVILWGGSKGGKSLISNGLIGQLHKDYPDAYAWKFNTEFRDKLQLTPRQREIWGIDIDRYIAQETNRPNEIFDVIENDVPKLVQAGMNLRLIVIDSVSDIVGRRSLNTDTVETQQMGDEALTIKDGLKRIKSVVKRLGITLVMVAQERAEMDPNEQRKHRTVKMHASNYLKHFGEYFIHVKKEDNSDGNKDINGVPLTIDMTDSKDKQEQIGHKISFKMQDSTIGPKYRSGEFTLNYYNGLMNVNEEVFTLACNRNIVERPNNRTYILKGFPEQGKDMSWSSKADFLDTIRDNDQVTAEIVKRLKTKDIEMMRTGVYENEVVAEKTED